MIRAGNQADLACPAAGGSLSAHHRRTGKTMVTADDQHMAVVALVAIRPSRRQQCVQVSRHGHPAIRRHLAIDIPVHLQIEETQLTAMHRTLTGQQTPLETDKATGQLC